MFKADRYTCFFKTSLVFFAIFFGFGFVALSQDGANDTTVSVDTLIEEEDYLDSDTEPPVFDSVNLFTMPSFSPYQIADSVIQNMKADEAFWYVDKVPNRQKPPEVDPNKKYKEPFYLQNWFRTLLWVIIIGAFIAVLVWFLIASDIKLFRKKAKPFPSQEDMAISEDIFSVDYEQELEKAIANGNYRLGVRLMYLHVLRMFSEKSIIQYKIERTNSDYLLQLSNTSYYKDFFRLTRNFEYVWYGKFDISPAAFEMIKQDYSKIKSQL